MLNWRWQRVRWFRSLFAPGRTIRYKPRRTVRPWLEALENRWLPAPMTFTVTDTSDASANSLRAAITASNANAPGAGMFNTIDFAIGSGVQTISLLSALPAITQPVDILGFTEGGAGYSGPPLVVLNGASAGSSSNGLDFAAGSNGSEVQGLVIQEFGKDGILLTGTNDNLIVGNFVGTDITGTAKLGNTTDGVGIFFGATGNTVGGTASGAANVISGNGINGVDIVSAGTSGNVVLGNRIGTDITGTAQLGNTLDGVSIVNGATGNTVGGTASGAANVIAFNAKGVVLSGTTSVQNSLLGNSIFGNTGPGIDLGNPPANHGQKAPLLTSLSTTSSSTTVKGSLTSSPGTYRVEFFASPASVPILQGKTFLGFANVTVPAGGTMAFTASGLAALPAGSLWTATATNTSSGALHGDTSAFSQAASLTLVVSASPSTIPFGSSQAIALTAQVLSGGTPVNRGVVTFTIVPAAGGAPIGTLRAAVSNGTAKAQFVIPAGTKPGSYKIVGVYHDSSGFFPDLTATSGTDLAYGGNRRRW
ncbi:MAG TPA: right-handed parallel beta-helix repeat-containing protein [Gemmataceae bacterium]|nr:right-handed parallel beta-helix repeat-containing protein [Gemmataceae bacterium]